MNKRFKKILKEVRDDKISLIDLLVIFGILGLFARPLIGVVLLVLGLTLSQITKRYLD